MNKATAIYCRTASPDADAIAIQRYFLQRCADENGYTDLIFYEDDGYSALDPNRPAFTRLEQDIRDGMVERVLTKSLSRLGRNTAEVVRWMIWLRRHGVTLLSQKEPFTLGEPSDLDQLLTALEEGVTQQQREADRLRARLLKEA